MATLEPETEVTEEVDATRRDATNLAGDLGGHFDSHKLLWAAPFAAVVGAFLNAIVWGIAKVSGLNLGISQAIGATPEPLGIGQVLLSSMIPALAGGALFALLTKFVSRAGALFLAVAAAVLLLSFLPIATTPMDSLATRVTLAVMHVVTAGSTVAMLLWMGRGASKPPFFAREAGRKSTD